MTYYKVESSHWQNELEFKSQIPLKEGQCFRIKENDSCKKYPTRFKVKKVSDKPEYTGALVEILAVDTVDSF